MGRMKDYMRELPDEILEKIISYLPLNEAAATSILSTRWRHLWKTVDYPIFDIDIQRLISINRRNKSLGEKRIFCLVSAILDQYQGSTIDELRIRFPHTSVVNFWSSDDMTPVISWINTAFQKRVKNLELDLQVFVRKAIDIHSHLLPCNFISLVSLRLVALTYLSHSLIHYFLSNCPFLRELYMERITSLPDLIICGPKLKHFTLIDSDVESLEISAPNLVSFEFSNDIEPTICFKNTPSLKHVSLEGYDSYVPLVSGNLDPILNLVSHLDSLALTQSDEPEISWRRPFLNFPTLGSLKQLQLSTCHYNAVALDTLILLLNASPELIKLSVIILEDEFGGSKSERNCFTMCSHHHHQRLEVVEIVGFGGSEREIEFAGCLADYAAASIKKIIVHPGDSKAGLLQLRRRLPSAVKLHIF
ncbi:F-box/FBD/LRR-repeat protein At5g22660-like [Mercurialis annua]|uniref:F-box/FBD/LRR-repeat protein At5g22660-like n=1 Tax=Mercurialis annua TaxID=3986 RepID=UPI00215E1229|nr:F-box/FBD/LRR-repeat protein At5g22660-like [Mercurialis annua]